MNDAINFDQMTVTLDIDREDGKVSVEEIRLLQAHLGDLLVLMLRESECEE